MSDPITPITPATTTASYEFSADQNKVISDLANSLHWVAAPLYFLGILYVIATATQIVQAFRDPMHIFPAIYILLFALISLSLASWTKSAAESFERVAQTTGKDISYLMEALDNLRAKYSLLSFFVKFYVAIMLVAIVASVLSIIFKSTGVIPK